MNEHLYNSDPRSYALQMSEEGYVSTEYLLKACLVYMSHDEVRDMLDANELSPRFHEEEEY